MDYEKLSEQSLDAIMDAIREENRKSISASDALAGHGDLCLDADLSDTDQFLSLASVGTQVGLRKSAMRRKHGLVRVFLRAVEAVYLRLAQLTTRDVRDFASAVISLFHVLKRKLEQLFRNDRIFDSRLAEAEQKLCEAEARLAEALEKQRETEARLAELERRLDRIGESK